MKNRVKIIHVVNYDKKFYESVISSFLGDRRFYNEILIVANDKSSIPTDLFLNPLILNVKEAESFICTQNYDCVFFHSLPDFFWNLLLKVPHDKKVIWWGWGFDLYSIPSEINPILSINLYKNQSLLFYLKNILKGLKNEIKYGRLKKKVIRRIDYFQPVIKYEFELLKRKYSYFKASEFYYPNSFYEQIPYMTVMKNSHGNILFGNSATPSNNHISVWNNISGYLPASQKCIIPLNYGPGTYAQKVDKEIHGDNVLKYLSFLEKDKYFNLLNSCSYAVFGVMRQQAMGNISYCIETGMKIFLYKDSIVYKYLKELGIIVFPIEEIDSNSFAISLTLEQANHNIMIYNDEAIRRTKVLDDFFYNYLRE